MSVRSSDLIRLVNLITSSSVFYDELVTHRNHVQFQSKKRKVRIEFLYFIFVKSYVKHVCEICCQLLSETKTRDLLCFFEYFASNYCRSRLLTFCTEWSPIRTHSFTNTSFELRSSDLTFDLSIYRSMFFHLYIVFTWKIHIDVEVSDVSFPRFFTFRNVIFD